MVDGLTKMKPRKGAWDRVALRSAQRPLHRQPAHDGAFGTPPIPPIRHFVHPFAKVSPGWLFAYEQRSTLPSRPSLPSPKTQHADRPETPEPLATPLGVIPLCRVLHSDGAVWSDKIRNRVPVDREAIKGADDHDAGALLQYALQRLQVGRERARVEIVEPEPRSRPNGGGRHVKTGEGRERNGRVLDLSHGQLNGDLQSLCTTSEQDGPVGGVLPLELGAEMSLSIHSGTERMHNGSPNARGVEGRICRKLPPQNHGIRRTTRGPSMLAMGRGSRLHTRGPHEKARSSGEGVAARC